MHTDIARLRTRRGKQWSSSAVCVRSFVTKKVRTFARGSALLIALIALVCVGAVALAGTKVSQVFTNIAGQIPAGT